MVLDDLVQVLQQSSFLAAVLAGFAVTLFVGLLTAASQRRIVAFAAAAALVAGALLAVATIAGISGVVAAFLDPEAAVGPAQDSTVFGAFLWMKASFLLGMVAFIFSLGLSGWIRSNRLGMVSSSIAAVTILSLVYFLVAVVGGL